MGYISDFLAKRNAKGNYQKVLSAFLSDGKLDQDEKRQLEQFASQHGLGMNDIQRIHQQALSALFKDISKDKRITEEESQDLHELMGHFGLKLTEFDFNQATYAKYYWLAMIEKEVLPTVPNDQLNIIFREGEILHWTCPATLKKVRRVTTQVGYRGFSGSVKIVKGFRYRFGSVQLAPTTKEVMNDEDQGIFWMTSYRTGFLGPKKSFTIPYPKILSFDFQRDLISIRKEGRETPHLVGLGDAEFAAAMLSALLSPEA